MKSGKKLSVVQERALKAFLKEKTLPSTAGNLLGLNENLYFNKMLFHLGFKILGKDGSFLKCIFPKGWKKILVSQSNEWCYVIDNKKRKRMAIFYKVLFKHGGMININSFVNMIPFYKSKVDYINKEKELYKGIVVDGFDKVIFTTETVNLSSENAKDKNKKFDLIFNTAENWLRERYPNYKNVIAYWDESDVSKIIN